MSFDPVFWIKITFFCIFVWSTKTGWRKWLKSWRLKPAKLVWKIFSTSLKDDSIFLQNKLPLISMNLFSNVKFTNCLKLSNIRPAFKKGVRTSKNNYIPMNIILVFSKIFGKLLQKQLLVFFVVQALSAKYSFFLNFLILDWYFTELL